LQVDLFEDSVDFEELLLVQVEQLTLLKYLQHRQLGHVQQVSQKLNILLLLLVVLVDSEQEQVYQ
jgi:hypothetical protein